MTYIYNKNELYHYGIKGQKWGIRNYQNADGSYTSKGKAENGGHGRYSKFSYGDKEWFIKKQKRLHEASRVYRKNFKENPLIYPSDWNSNRISESRKFKKEYKDKYGLDYDDAYVFGVKTADKIAKTAHDKHISNEKATNIVLMKKLAVYGLITACTYGIMKFAENNPEEFNKILSTASKTIKKGANYASYYTKKGVDELKSRLDPNVINVKSKVIPKEVYQLPYKMFEKNKNVEALYSGKLSSSELLKLKNDLVNKTNAIYKKYTGANDKKDDAMKNMHSELAEYRPVLDKVLSELKKYDYSARTINKDAKYNPNKVFKDAKDKLNEAKKYTNYLFDKRDQYRRELSDVYDKYSHISPSDSIGQRNFQKELDEVRSKLRDVNDRIKKDTNYNSIFQDKVMDYYAIKDNIRLKKNN